MPRPKSVPTYCVHKRSGRAFVTVDGRQIPLGKAGSPESRAAFDRLLGEWYYNGRTLPQAPTAADGATPDKVPPNTVSMLIEAFWRHAQVYYAAPVLDRDGRFIYSEIQTLRMKDNASAVFIYPNPARSFINVEADMVQAAQVSIRISDGAGKEVNHTEFKGNNGLNIQRIDVTNLAAGRYVMTILMGSETQSIPFVKSN